jgi:putative endonuclease
MDRKDAGMAAEDAACRWLEAQGLRLHEKNFRCRTGEIDLIMRDGPVVALIEVRMRSSSCFGGAAGSVDWKKQRRLIAAARYLTLVRTELRNHPFRFDVVTLEPEGPSVQIRWIKDAFRLP